MAQLTIVPMEQNGTDGVTGHFDSAKLDAIASDDENATFWLVEDENGHACGEFGTRAEAQEFVRKHS